MLKRLLTEEWAEERDADAREMERWNKATINGVKNVLPGLTKRR